MTGNSIEAYTATKEMRQTNKRIVLECLSKNPKSSRYEVGRITGLGHLEAQRRLSDLKNEGKVLESGTRKHFKRQISLYSLDLQMKLYESKKSLKEWLKSTNPEILKQYDNYKNDLT